MAKQIIRQGIDSSMLRAVGYDPAHSVLQAEYKTGQVWNYLNVSQSKYDELMSSTSKGRYMHDHILGYHAEIRIIRKKRFDKDGRKIA